MPTDMPYSATLWDAAEQMTRDQIEHQQLALLQRQLQYVETHSAYYQRLFAAHGFRAADVRTLDDLQKLPVTHKDDYIRALVVDPPYGEFCAADPRDVVRVHFSSGTTGKPTPVYWTRRDVQAWSDLYARYMYGQGMRAGDIFQCMYNYAWFVAGLGATYAAERIGAMVIPGSAGDTQRQITTMQEFGTHILAATPSFLAHLAETAHGMGIDPRSLKVRALATGGEPGASILATRKRLESLWDADLFDCYGALEFQPIAWEMARKEGPVLAEDFLYAEVLDADTLQPVPDGTPGVLVLTHLRKEACPLVRWWTGDVVVRDRRMASDGRTHARLVGGVLGRADDMLIVRGVNVFPSAIENVIRTLPDAGDEFIIDLENSPRGASHGFLEGLLVKIETHVPDAVQFAAHAAHILRDRLKVRFEVQAVPPGSLPRYTHKAKRVVRGQGSQP